MATRMIRMLVMALFVPVATAASLPDPTALPVMQGAEAVSEAPVLAWVKVNGKRSVAWYGGTTVKLGDTVEGGRITAIREDHIVILGKGGRRTVYLLDESIRTKLQAPPRPARQTRN